MHQHPVITTSTAVMSLGAALMQDQADRREMRRQAAQDAADQRSATRLVRAIRQLQAENARLTRELDGQVERAARAEAAFIELARRAGIKKAA
jgi:hypothetical protein